MSLTRFRLGNSGLGVEKARALPRVPFACAPCIEVRYRKSRTPRGGGRPSSLTADGLSGVSHIIIIEYLPGDTNPADPLSRIPDTPVINPVMVMTRSRKRLLEWEELLAAYAADDTFADISTMDQYDQDHHGLYSTKGKNIVVPNCQELEATILVHSGE
ncbi:hypothetical protein HaLaN_21781, partial [Haematococcus lacustris]